MGTMIQAKHYQETEQKLSEDMRVRKLMFEFIQQGGEVENIDFHATLAINKEASRRGIDTGHIGALKEAFKLIYKEMQEIKRELLKTRAGKDISKEQAKKLRGMAEQGAYKLIKV